MGVFRSLLSFRPFHIVRDLTLNALDSQSRFNCDVRSERPYVIFSCNRRCDKRAFSHAHLDCTFNGVDQ